MSLIDRIQNPRARLFVPLQKASGIELFFDLVFIFCMRNIIPILTQAGDAALDWYTYYTFGFTFMLMLQIWFYATLLMNRYGTGGGGDSACLLICMFLLLVMTHAISTGWENYMIYNVAWILINVNFAVHWLRVLFTYKNLDEDDRVIIMQSVGIIVVQVVLVGIASFLPSLPAQILCALAVAVGFGNMTINNRYKRKPANFEHLTERCALLIILTLGETVIAVGAMVNEQEHWVYGLFMFAVIALCFLIYNNQYVKLVDHDMSCGGMGYMALTSWLTFLVANLTAAMEMAYEDLPFIIPAELYVSLSLCAFLLSFSLFKIYNRKDFTRGYGYIVVRIIACAIILTTPVVGAHFTSVVAACVGVLGLVIVAIYDWNETRSLEFKGR